MKNFKTFTWYLVFYFLPVFAIACGGSVDSIDHTRPYGTAGEAGTTGSGGSAGSVATGGSAGEAGFGGSGGSPGSSGEAGVAGGAGTSSFDAGGDAPDAYPPYCNTNERRLRDLDGDSYGDPENYIFVNVCAPWEDGYVNWITGNDDCDDGNPDVHPGAPEVPGNGIDDNCNGVVDEEVADAGADADAGCEPALHVKTVWFASGDVPLGNMGVPMFRMELTPNDCEDLEVKAVDMQLTSPDAADQMDSSLFCAEPCTAPADWNFGSVKVMRGTTMEAGPISFARIGNPPVQGNSITKAYFTDTITIAKGVTTTLEVRMDVADAEVAPMVGKRFMLDLAGLGAWSAAGLVTPTWQMAVPTSTITIVDSTQAELSIELAADTPTSMIVVPGGFRAFTKYVVRNNGTEPLYLNEMDVSQMSPGGRMSDFVWIQIRADGAPWGSAGMPGTVIPNPLVWDIDRWEPHVIQPTGAIVIELQGYMANPSSSSSAGPDSPRSGDTPSLQISRMNAYRGSATSPDVVGQIQPHIAPSMVLRKSKPTITVLPLPFSGPVANGVDQDLFKFQVTADVSGPVSFDQLGLATDKTAGLAVSNLRLRRGATDMDPSTALVMGPGTDGALVIRFPYEEFISGSGSVYTLHGTVTYQVSATPSLLTIGFDRTTSTTPVTGFLHGPGGGPVQSVNPADAQYPYNTVPGWEGITLWSDLSEVPHSTQSGDWTHDLYLEDLSQTQTLVTY